jgi:hypothetical protein
MTGERTHGAARDQIRRSLERLRVDHVDLIQHHNLALPNEWEIAKSDLILLIHLLGGHPPAGLATTRSTGTRMPPITGTGLPRRIAGLARIRAALDSVARLCPTTTALRPTDRMPGCRAAGEVDIFQPNCYNVAAAP